MNKFFNLINIHRAVFFLLTCLLIISLFISLQVCAMQSSMKICQIFFRFQQVEKKSDNIIPHYSFNCARSTRKYTFEDISKVSSYVFYIAFMENIILFFVDIIIIFFSWYCPLQLQKHSFPTNFVYAVQWNCECFTISTNWKILSTNRILRQKKGVSCLLFVIVLHSIPLFYYFRQIYSKDTFFCSSFLCLDREIYA